MINWLKENRFNIAFLIVLLGLFGFFSVVKEDKKPLQLKEYKDGIQNHLTWNIKGECYFVRPNDDVTVYLIRVADCDKK